MPTPAVKNSKISSAMPMTNSRNAIGGLATVCISWSNRPRPLNTGVVETFCSSPLSSSCLTTVLTRCPSIVLPSIASTMLRTVGTPWSVVSSFSTPAARASLKLIDPLTSSSVAAPKLIGLPSTMQRRADVADAAAADHRGDIGDRHQLRRQAVGARRTRRADPDADRHLGIGRRAAAVTVISASTPPRRGW